MKMERLSQDKIRIFLTFDDLTERGIQKDDMWREIPKVHELFSDMMDQAYTELGFDPSGPLAVEVLALPAQGMVVIVTRSKMDFHHSGESYDEEVEEMYELEVTLEQSDQISYVFHDFEDLLRMAKVLQPMVTDGGILFSYKNKWFLQLDAVDMEENGYQAVIAVLSEYGDAASVTRAVLEEYGKTVIAADAVNVLCTHFK
ncbi:MULTISPECIES: genetic competence negative regulator [Paenibacillus]|uniref:Genetic competence negative regulator n=1 Tax=Paenibacillus radicis (ex Xue et al. 2023) TaxID=2972489 RepID=A0ABT1YMM1_9BACL|nr:genetic competence negative regulator [Paenibacillus radicis (ex Xue et al. 2023)]MCR8634432.1 genetic competence negative regulator [Paenibacillus radicis (ex Xue et al. 2023)]